jgi:hypothetical protein
MRSPGASPVMLISELPVTLGEASCPMVITSSPGVCGAARASSTDPPRRAGQRPRFELGVPGSHASIEGNHSTAALSGVITLAERRPPASLPFSAALPRDCPRFVLRLPLAGTPAFVGSVASP